MITSYPPASSIKSVQSGTASLTSGVTSLSITISAVNTGRSRLELLGQSVSADAKDQAIVVLTNSTTIDVSRQSSVGSVNVSWRLVEEL